jgi:hypothetical protein
MAAWRSRRHRSPPLGGEARTGLRQRPPLTPALQYAINSDIFVATKLTTLRASSTKFMVRAVSNGTVVLQGKPGEPRDDAASGDRVQIADISPVRQPGMYVLQTDAGKNAPFEIGDDVYLRSWAHHAGILRPALLIATLSLEAAARIPVPESATREMVLPGERIDRGQVGGAGCTGCHGERLRQ